MSNLLYLLVAVVVSGVGCALLWLRHRKPHNVESGIDEFTRELRALAPDQRDDRGGRTG